MIQCGGNAMWNIKNWRLLEIIQILSSKSLPQMCCCDVDPIFRLVSSSYTKNKRNKNYCYTKCDGKIQTYLSNIVWQTRATSMAWGVYMNFMAFSRSCQSPGKFRMEKTFIFNNILYIQCDAIFHKVYEISGTLMAFDTVFAWKRVIKKNQRHTHKWVIY